jgi:hypothetical protein
VTSGPPPSLEQTLRRAETLVAAARAFAIALEDLPALDLPPPASETMGQGQLRAIATLYLASELEAAGVVPAAEDLMRLARSGSLPVDLRGATPLLQTFWLGRNERASTEERRSCFSGLFGAAGGPDSARQRRNDGFEDRLVDLCEALYKLDEQASNPSWGGVAQQARARAAARQLLENLAASASGLTVFLAQEILATIRQALQILGHPDVVAAFGARSVQDVVAAIDRRLRRPPAADFDLRVRRGQAGMTILAWLADAAPLLASSEKPLVGIDHPVIPAAVDWLQASLALTEAPAPAASPPPATPGDASGWDALAS